MSRSGEGGAAKVAEREWPKDQEDNLLGFLKGLQSFNVFSFTIILSLLIRSLKVALKG